VAEQIHRAQREAAGDPLGPSARVERAEAPERQAEEGGLGIAIRREPRQALDDPRPLPQPLEVLAHPHEGMDDVEVVDATSSLRPVSKKTSSPSVKSSSALPKRERVRRADLATPRTRPWSRV
jgi:hypothetical protein